MEEIKEEEIDLKDYLKIILKRKWFILGIGLTVTITTLLFSFFSPKVYEISTSIEIGKSFKESNPLENPIQVKTKIEEGIYKEIQ